MEKEAMCLIKGQARHVYRKVESESVINVNTVKQEIEKEKLSKNNIDDKYSLTIM